MDEIEDFYSGMNSTARDNLVCTLFCIKKSFAVSQLNHGKVINISIDIRQVKLFQQHNI
jgi:hypothetical protein